MTVAVQNLTKRYGSRTVLHDLSFDLEPGQVIGFLGPNGSGKSTTMKIMLGLVRPDEGSVTWDGSTFADLPRAEPHGRRTPRRTGHRSRPQRRDHLRVLAMCGQMPPSRVDAVLELTGMTSVADENVGGFSLGMHQRWASQLRCSANPSTCSSTNPPTGSTPRASSGSATSSATSLPRARGVLVSSHLLAELSNVVDHLVVIGKGRLIRQASVAEFIQQEQSRVRVRSPRSPELAQLLMARQLTIEVDGEALLVSGTTAALVGDLAAVEGTALHELITETVTLEAAFLAATAEAQEYRSGTTPEGSP